MRKPIHGLTPAAERVLLNSRWEGNVRELKNVIERACMLAEGTLLSERELAGAFGPELHTSALSRGRIVELPGRVAELPGRVAEATAPLEAIEREHILDVLRQVNGNRMAAAKLLGISRRALYRRLDRHHLGDEAPPPAARRVS
jgi:two-component system response regulator AtoC